MQAFSGHASFPEHEPVCWIGLTSGDVGSTASSDPLNTGTSVAVATLGGRSVEFGVGSLFTCSATASSALRVSSMSFGRPTAGSPSGLKTKTVGGAKTSAAAPRG